MTERRAIWSVAGSPRPLRSSRLPHGTVRQTVLRGAFVLASVAGIGQATAQSPRAARELPLKESTPAAEALLCPPAPTLPPVAASRRAEAREQLSAGNRAALVGDLTTARDAFQRAADLDPADPDAVYRLARAHEDLGEKDQAAQRYCHFLSVASASPDAADVRQRIADLYVTGAAAAEQAIRQFRTGLAEVTQGQLVEAERSFSNAARLAPSWADPHFNLAVVHEAQGQNTRATGAFRSYLQLQLNAPDRGYVLERIRVLRSLVDVSSPPGALMRGLLLPGAGQLYTGRPALGALILGGAAASAYVAFRPERVTYIERIPINPFDPTRFEEVERERTERPDVAKGLALAGAITALGAIEAYLYARRQQPPAAVGGLGRTVLRPAIRPAPRGDRIEIGLDLILR